MHERPILRSLLRTAQQQPCRRALSTSKAVPSRTHLRSQALRASCRPLSTTASRRIDITEGADSKTTKKSEPHWKPTAPTPISDEKYQEQSDHYFERLLEQLEMLQEEKGDMDVEYSVCPTLPLTLPLPHYSHPCGYILTELTNKHSKAS